MKNSTRDPLEGPIGAGRLEPSSPRPEWRAVARLGPPRERAGQRGPLPPWADSPAVVRLRRILEALRTAALRPVEVIRLVRDARRYGRFGATLRARSWAQGLACHGYDEYAAWCERYEPLDPVSRARMRRRIESFRTPPLITVVMSTYNIPADFLRAAIQSVEEQIYPYWELCIADNASPDPHVGPILEDAARSDPRIKVVFRETNEKQSVARNTAMTVATGSFVTFLDADDRLSAHALFMIAQGILTFPDTDVFYADEDRLDELGRRYCPYFKPAWDPELILCNDYVHQPMVFRRTVLDTIGGFRKGYEGSEDWDVLIRAVDEVGADRVRHIPHILYHWRRFSGSGSFVDTQLDRVERQATRVVSEHLSRCGRSAGIGRSAWPGCLDLALPLPPHPPKVTVVLGGDRAARRHDELLSNTDYPCFDTVVGEARNGTGLAALNEAGLAASGDVLVFLTQSLRPHRPTWLAELVALLARPGIGAAGPKVVSRDGRVLQATMVLGGPFVSESSHFGQIAVTRGYEGRLVLLQRCSALGIDGLTTRRDHFRAANGFDTEPLGSHLAVTDYCLRLRQMNLACAWTYRSVLHDERSFSEAAKELRSQAPTPAAVDEMRTRWGEALDADPFHNPNLSPAGGRFELARPPRIPAVWTFRDG